jgi:hypothetical protein
VSDDDIDELHVDLAMKISTLMDEDPRIDGLMDRIGMYGGGLDLTVRVVLISTGCDTED